MSSCAPARKKISSRTEALLLQEDAAQNCSMPYRAPELFDVPSDSTIDERTDVVHHHSRFPLNILRQRDAVIWRHVLERAPSAGLYTLVWRACRHPGRPPSDDITRIRSSGCYRIVAQAGGGVDVYSLVFSDLGGSIPMALIRVSSVPVLLRTRSRIEELCRRRRDGSS